MTSVFYFVMATIYFTSAVLRYGCWCMRFITAKRQTFVLKLTNTLLLLLFRPDKTISRATREKKRLFRHLFYCSCYNIYTFSLIRVNCCASHNYIDFKRVNIDIAVHSDQIKCPEYMYECIERTWESFEMFKLFKITMYIQRNYCYRKYIKFIETRLHVQKLPPIVIWWCILRVFECVHFEWLLLVK